MMYEVSLIKNNETRERKKKAYCLVGGILENIFKSNIPVHLKKRVFSRRKIPVIVGIQNL